MLDTFMEILLNASWISDCTKMANWSTRYCSRQACCGVISNARLSMSLSKCHSVYRSFMKHKQNYLLYINILFLYITESLSDSNYLQHLIVSLLLFFYHKTTIFYIYIFTCFTNYIYIFILLVVNEWDPVHFQLLHFTAVCKYFLLNMNNLTVGVIIV